ncbi:MAG TPA: hypothetical protein VJC10_03530 [Patescibacteria group bacterium]|nr:hypothetical protein [Patescibacteria group bacterium]
MSNREIAMLLKNVAAAYAIKNEQKYRFQIIAYQKAADAIESSTSEVGDLIQDNKLNTLSGVGSSIQASLQELIKTGKVKHFQEIMEDVPKAVFPLLNIPSFGPKKAYKLVTHFKLNNDKTVIEDIEKIARTGKIADLEGFGEKSQSEIVKAIAEFHSGTTKNVRMVLPFAQELAEKIITYLKQSPDVLEAYPLGSLRRQKSTIGDVDIAVATNKSQAVIEHFVNYPYKERVLEKGTVTAGLLVSGGKHIDLMVQPPDRFGSLLQHSTGSKQHNIHLREYALKKGLSLSERGIKKLDAKTDTIEKFKTEEAFYNALGLDWMPPEIREDTGEIEAALSHTLPKLVELSDIKGDFHLHSSFPIEPSHDMGKDTMEIMIEKAKKLGYKYLGFSEHNPSLSKHTKEQIYSILAKRREKIEHLNMVQKSVRVFSLLETDILPNGSLAIDDKAAAYLDATLVSIHSVFGMDKKTMTKRVLTGLSHPKAKILTHPTGRLLNQRNGYELNWEEVFLFCKEQSKAVEINAFPNRLDLPDELVREALKYGVKFFIDTDSHAVEQMDMMRYGVSVAQRGWATKDDIMNTLEYNVLAEWFKK